MNYEVCRCSESISSNLDPFSVLAPLFGLRDGPIGIEAVVNEGGVYPVAPGEEEQSEETQL